MPVAEDQPSPPDSQARISDRLGEIALILSAGEGAESATLDSLRRLGCHLCGQLGHADCHSAPDAANDCPLAATRHDPSCSA